MPTYNIRGIDVDFPFKAYDSQLVYMEKVIESLQTKCNALLESPTGTGKTLCLLCATLAWRKSLGEFSTGKECDYESSEPRCSSLPTIIYTSRTHSQLRQVVQELKRSNYRPKMVVLGSREQFCIHDEVSLLRGKAQKNACHYLCKKNAKRKCKHNSGVLDAVKSNPELGDEPIDIEELVDFGKKLGTCPYYISRVLHKVVDIVFAPYNYIIDRAYRKSLTINWSGSVLIFDEAHNLESICADAASFDLPSGLLTACISEAKSCIDLSVGRREKSNDQTMNPDNFAILRALLLKLDKRIAEVPIESRELGFTRPGPYIYELLADLNITHDTSSNLINIIEDAVLLLEEDKQQNAKGSVSRLESIADILQLVFRDDKNNAHAHYYRVHVQEDEAKAVDILKGTASRTLSWWCFNPGIAMEAFSKLDVGSIILTSGTLSPLDSFAQELNLDFPIRLENPHVITPNQIWAGIVPSGPSGRSFNSSYRTRDHLDYKQELGNAIVNFARIVPDGLLVFFPSYYLLDQCIECWKNVSATNATTIWERICKHKKPVLEPRQSSLFPLAIEDYMSKLKDCSTSGAVFFAVCRGKVSEGLDFADHAGRAVIVTGIPFALRNDPKVRLKREYMDEIADLHRDGRKTVNGEEWYSQQASRAVNQAVGRVIRHRHDYGAIIFCDERFLQPNRQSQISLWIQPYIKCYSKFGDVVFTLSRFFRDAKICGPTKPNLIQSERTENLKDVKALQPVDKLYPDNVLTPTTPVDQDTPVKSLSSLLEVKRVKDSCQLKDVLPANRSFLTPFKEYPDIKLKSSSGVICNVKNLPIPGRKNGHHQNYEIIDLTGESVLNEDQSSEKFLTPSSAKKRKVCDTQHVSQGPVECNDEHVSNVEKSQSNGHLYPLSLLKLHGPRICDNKSSQDSGLGSGLPQKHQIIAERGDSNFLTKKDKGVQSTSVNCGDEGTRGAAFLIEVKEKLSAREYKEFVGFMKALKSKAMKIDHVLQSIVRLFAGTERISLLKRFKDYIPGKYHSLYENYLEANNKALDNERR